MSPSSSIRAGHTLSALWCTTFQQEITQPLALDAPVALSSPVAVAAAVLPVVTYTAAEGSLHIKEF